MQGVTVIESFSKDYTVFGIILAVSAAALLVCGIAFVVWVLIDAWREKEVGVAVIGTIFVGLTIAYIVLSTLGAVTLFTPVEYKRVKVDPSANYWEFTQKYKIDSQEGDEYVVREREEASE